MKKLAFVIVVLSMFISCKKAETTGKYFAFGSAYNFSIGDHATFYLLKNCNLYPDNMERYTNQKMNFKDDKLSKDKYKLAKKLQDEIPNFLKERPSEYFGCPDCADQGGYHIEIGDNKSVRTFHIDTDVSKQPTEIREFVASLKSVLEELEK
jgi:hypothetical protein